jgi:hypothetical protein
MKHRRNNFHASSDELEFLHPVQSTGHVLRFGQSWARNVDAMLLMLRWALYTS